MFGLANRLFQIEVEAADGDVPVWNKDVRFFRIMQASPDHPHHTGESLQKASLAHPAATLSAS